MSSRDVDAEKAFQDVQIEHVSDTVLPTEDRGARKQPGEVFPGITKESILAFLAICTQLSAYEMTLLTPAVAIGYINAELGPSPNYAWINITWSLGAAILVSVGGRLSDIFGRRYFMLCGAIISFVGTIVGATGQSIAQMIVSGVLFGIGSGFQEMGFACIMEFIPNRYRVTALGLYGTLALPCICTPLITYAFIAHTSIGWRGAYWVMTGWHGFGLLCMYFFYHPPTFNTKHGEERVSKWTLLRELDYIGLFLFTAGTTLFLVGLSFGGRRYPWVSATVIAPIVVGFSCFVALFVWVFNVPMKYPLLPPQLFRQWRGYNVLVVVSFCLGMLYYSMQVLWPRQSSLLFASADQPIMRGVYANLTLWGTWLSLISVWVVCARIGHEKWQIMFFVCVQTVLIGCLSSVQVDQKAKAIALVFIMSCFINQALYLLFGMVSLNIKDQGDMGVAIGAMSTFRLLGGAVATAIYSSIVDNQFAGKLPTQLRAAVAGTDFDPKNLATLAQAAAINTAAAYKKVPGISDQIVAASQWAVKLAYVEAFKVVYYTALGFALLAIGSALLVSNTDPAKKNMDKAVILENEKQSASGTTSKTELF
ncbi:uncharacterized protein HMPREF1541_07044 [Cyphellophora europaea CBS 101466]|uniref:Major facilitator superfamily (MFS) profile domain-containing protein n=1 Tax=Cyphellophora europaea (strain CBS 101466) TaxID=1220924 RepID=W2RRC3_CYPE1|nr:uncharacterized protein HMPREF1541_07044 [Cyphellophora europaea CBS 101466]ETN39002.1 hypothetical protein HMPREF1541_07044 [Cyphellophora europaea CBS 101466]